MIHVTDSLPNLKNAEHIGRCCNRERTYLIEYVSNAKYSVCSECMKIPEWNYGVKHVHELSNVPAEILRCCSNIPSYGMMLENNREYLLCLDCSRHSRWTGLVKSEIKAVEVEK